MIDRGRYMPAGLVVAVAVLALVAVFCMECLL
jgi:hypothetical protein